MPRTPASYSGLNFGLDTFYNTRVQVSNIAAYQNLTAFTIETFICIHSWSGNAYPQVLSYSAGYGQYLGFYIFIYSAANKLGFDMGNGTNEYDGSASQVLSLETWYHYAASWDGTTVRIFINGVLGNSGTLSGGNIGNPNLTLNIGNSSINSNAAPVTLSEVRFSNIARYTANFTPPNSPFSPDTNTLGLWHFSEGSGTTTADASANANKGILTGTPLPVWTAGKWFLGGSTRTLISANIRPIAQNTTSSLGFNGTTSKVVTSLVPSNTAFGFMGWAKVYSNSGGAILGASTNAANGFILYWVAGKIEWQVYYTSSNSGVRINTNTSNQWNHIACCFDTTSGNLVLWVNGVMQTITPIAGTYATTTASITFGTFLSAQWFNGLLSRWSYMPSTITTQQVLANMQSGIVPNNAVETWSFNEGGGSTVYGIIGGNNGTITSASYTADIPYKTRSLVNGNLVYNAGFEFAPVVNVATSTTYRWIDGTSGGSTTNNLFGWLGNPLTNGMIAYFDNTQSHSGNYSLHISPNGNSNAACQIVQYSTLTPNIFGYIVPVYGTTVMFYSFWMKTVLNSGSATTGANMYFIERNYAGTPNGGPTSTNVVTTTGWTQYTGTWTTSAGTVYITPKIYYANTGGAATLNMDVWIDDIVIVPLATNTRSLAV